MTTLFGNKTGYYNENIPIKPIRYTIAILNNNFEIPLSNIKKIYALDNRLKIEYIHNEKLNIDHFESISFK